MSDYVGDKIFSSVSSMGEVSCTLPDANAAQSDTTVLNAVFTLSNVNNFFEHIYIPYTTIDSQGHETESWYDVGMNASNLSNAFYYKYFSRYFWRALSDTLSKLSNTAKVNLATFYANQINSILARNAYKYKNIITSLGFKYNPIDNYDMEELSGSWLRDGDITTTVTPSGKVTTENSRTQYDNATPTLETKSEVTYGSGTKTESTEKHDHLSNESIEDIYNSQTSTANVDRKAGTKLRRHGNIGVTTTQQMIEQQRKLVEYSIIDKFFEDIEKELLLNLYI